ncbi:MAG TPA: PASTA domain-containing protein, partial [Leptospiraceae bacterium]|nr:PASTA domain-containing protein [Leptospiraceae bacterium]
ESGGSLAAPVFARFVQSILPVLNESSQTFRVPDLAPIAQSAAAFEAGKIGDFRGMSAREARYLAARVYSIPVELDGSGYVKSQDPPPGTPAAKVKKIKLVLEP